MEEDAIRKAPVVPTGGQAGRCQAITDTTTIESSLVDLKEKGATPQDRRFLYVDCIKRITAVLGVGVGTIEPDHLLNHLVTSFVAQVGRAASVGSGARITVGNPNVVRLPSSSRSTGRRQVGSHNGSKQQQYIMLVTPSPWWRMWGAVLAVKWEGGGGVIVCK